MSDPVGAGVGPATPDPRYDCKIGWRTKCHGFGRNYTSPHCWKHIRDVPSIDSTHCPLGQIVVEPVFLHDSGAGL